MTPLILVLAQVMLSENAGCPEGWKPKEFPVRCSCAEPPPPVEVLDPKTGKVELRQSEATYSACALMCYETLCVRREKDEPPTPATILQESATADGNITGTTVGPNKAWITADPSGMVLDSSGELVPYRDPIKSELERMKYSIDGQDAQLNIVRDELLNTLKVLQDALRLIVDLDKRLGRLEAKR